MQTLRLGHKPITGPVHSFGSMRYLVPCASEQCSPLSYVHIRYGLSHGKETSTAFALPQPSSLTAPTTPAQGLLCPKYVTMLGFTAYTPPVLLPHMHNRTCSTLISAVGEHFRFVATPLPEGAVTLDQVAYKGSLPPAALAAAADRARRGLAAIHGAGVAHGDVRAHCRLLLADGRVVWVGLSCAVVGATPGHMDFQCEELEEVLRGFIPTAAERAARCAAADVWPVLSRASSSSFLSGVGEWEAGALVSRAMQVSVGEAGAGGREGGEGWGVGPAGCSDMGGSGGSGLNGGGD